MDRRSVVTMMVVTAASLIARTGHAQVKAKARNIVLVTASSPTGRAGPR